MTQRRGHRFRLLGLEVFIVTLALSMVSVTAFSAPPSDLATDLATLRADVEALHAELELERENQRSELRILAQQRAEVEAELRRSERRSEKLTLALSKLEGEVNEAHATRASFGPTLKRCVEVVLAMLEQSLPFKKEERLKSVTLLSEQVAEGKIAETTALARLWGLVEDELRLGRETGLYRQTIDLQGQRVLVDVVKVGMVMLFFQTADGGVGRAVKTTTGYRYESFDLSTAEGASQAQGVIALFDALKKRIKTGFFRLPNALDLRDVQ